LLTHYTHWEIESALTEILL